MLKTDPAIILAVVRGKRPLKPLDVNIPEQLWSLIDHCWKAEPVLRPRADDLVQSLSSGRNIPPAENWSDTLFAEVQQNISTGHQDQNVLAFLEAAVETQDIPESAQGAPVNAKALQLDNSNPPQPSATQPDRFHCVFSPGLQEHNIIEVTKESTGSGTSESVQERKERLRLLPKGGNVETERAREVSSSQSPIRKTDMGLEERQLKSMRSQMGIAMRMRRMSSSFLLSQVINRPHSPMSHPNSAVSTSDSNSSGSAYQMQPSVNMDSLDKSNGDTVLKLNNNQNSSRLPLEVSGRADFVNYESQLRGLRRLFDNETAYRKLLAQQGTIAQSLLAWLQQAWVSKNLRASICTTMVCLSKNSGIYPSCLTIRRVTKLGKYPVASGSFGNIWKGQIGEAGDQLVCLKEAKVYSKSDMNHLLKEYLREAIIWRQLRHPNLLPCLGLYYLDEDSQPICLVSPWMENGDLNEFLRNQLPETNDRIQFMHDITNGLSHLHALKIVHGDLKGVNVLITPSRRACIADFGLSRVADSRIFKSTNATRASGTPGFIAPEIYNGETSTVQSDIYSVGCVYYEIITGCPPFHNLRDVAVMSAVMLGKRPPRNNISDDLWSLMDDCWNHNPPSRPTAADLLYRLPIMDRTIAPAEDWDTKLFTELQLNVESTTSHHQEALDFLESLKVLYTRSVTT
ncbi:Rho guanine nucleotide exchange factor [Paramarasmius palmivorus]|uniref:Rho guanine nucleotide exchange factor n=1 Tax=Paramarasmius palmivorus TaxID=297713 RepID=A0AAW0BLK9_9AGAR